MAIILLLTLVGLMVGQNQGSSCDPSTLASKNSILIVHVNGSLVKDGGIHEMEAASQVQRVECQAKDATTVTLACDSNTQVSKIKSFVVGDFTMRNGARCVCSAQHRTLCFKNSIFTVQTKYLNGASRFFNPDFMVFFTVVAILASYF